MASKSRFLSGDIQLTRHTVHRNVIIFSCLQSHPKNQVELEVSGIQHLMS